MRSVFDGTFGRVFLVDYTGTTVLVTGAASGIGAALALQLSQRGALVICADRDSEGLADTVAAIGLSLIHI